MCDMNLAMLAISVVKAGSEYFNDANNAERQEDAIVANLDAQNQAISEQQGQINDQATDKMGERAREALIERGRLKAIQGESGLIGNTQDRVVGESYFNESQDMASIEKNRLNAIKQSELDRKGINTRGQGQLNQVKQPSLIGAGLQIGGAALTYGQSTKTTTKK
jgi:hypothetical protein